MTTLPAFHLARLGLALTVLTALSCHAVAQPMPDPRGRWITASGNLEVEVAPCGPALCGTVTRVLGNRSMVPGAAAMKAVDTRDPLGMVLLRGFVPVGPSAAGQAQTQWEGSIYNRENGKTYRCQMSVSTGAGVATELVLHAYVGIPLLGNTQRWQPAQP